MNLIRKAVLPDRIAQLLKHEKIIRFHYHRIHYECGRKLEVLQSTVDLAKPHQE